MIGTFLFKGLLIGCIFGIPLGAVGAISMQRTIQYGPKVGFMSGLASSVADMIYAGIGAFGLTIISEVLFKYQTYINIIGAGILIFIAADMILHKKEMVIEESLKNTKKVKIFLSSFFVAITNPAAILSFLFAFSVFNINGNLDIISGLQLVVGVFIGTLLWWCVLVFITNLMKHKINEVWYKRCNMIFSILLACISIGVLIHTLS